MKHTKSVISNKTYTANESDTHNNINKVNIMLQQMLRDCDSSIDYQEMDDEITLKKKGMETKKDFDFKS